MSCIPLYLSAMRSSSGRIAPSVLADLYLQLTRLEQAGLPAQQAFSLLDSAQRPIQDRLRQLRKYLKAGLPIAEAGSRSGLFSNSDKTLIEVGEKGGKLAAIYQQLAVYYGEQARRINRIKAKLYLPFFVLLLALLLLPLPALVQQQIGALEYLWLSFGRFVSVILSLLVLYRLPHWLCDGFLQFLGLCNSVHRLQCRLPLLTWSIKRQQYQFFRSLGLLLEAGVAMVEALPMAVDVINNPLLRKQFEFVYAEIDQGSSLVEALANVDFVDRHALRLLESGEYSGKLAETLLHYCRLQAEEIAIQDDMLADWMPRLFYLIVAGWVAFSIIDGFQFSRLNF